MSLSERDLGLLESNPSAAMITVAADEEELLQHMVDDQRLLYQFEVSSSYGMV